MTAEYLNRPLVQAKLVQGGGSQAYEASRVLSGRPGLLLELLGYNSKASTQFILIFDATAVPADGAVPTLPPITVPATSNFTLDLGIYGYPFQNGIVVCNSSTGPTKTVGSADCWFTAKFI